MSLQILFASNARVKVLELFLTHSSERFYQREMAQRAGLPIQAVQRELARLQEIGLVTKIPEGNRSYYQVNRQYYIFRELKGIFMKSGGIGKVLQQAVGRQKGIDFAFIFGSVARGTEKSGSDIDLLVLGSISAKGLNNLIFPVSQKTGREINQHLFVPGDFERRVRSGNHFAARIAKGPKLFLVGTADEFKQLIKETSGVAS